MLAPKSVRNLLRLIAPLLVLPLVVSCTPAGPGASGATGGEPAGEITLVAYTGIFQDNYTKAVIEPFTKKYPKVKVTYDAPGNSAQILAKLRTQKDDPQVDVVIMDDSISKLGNDEDIFASLDPTVVTSLADLKDEAVTPNNFGPSVTFDNFVLVYSTALVKPAPTSWGDMWNSAYKGKIALAAPPNIQGLAFTILIDKMQGGDYKQTVDPAIAKLKELAPLVSTWDPQPDGYTLVINGEAAMATGWNARAQLYADQSQGKLGVLLPKEGSVFQKNTINLIKGSKNAQAAQLFIQHALSPESQKAFTEAMFYAPVNKKAQISDAALKRTAVAPELASRMVPVDWIYVSQARDKWLERWRKEVLVQ